jgi:hypothetical protein
MRKVVAVTTEGRALTPRVGGLSFGLTLAQYDLQSWLNKKIANDSEEDQAVRINNWLITEALSAYGAVREASFLLAKTCEGDTVHMINDAKSLLRQVVDHLEHNEQDVNEARELYERLMELESDVILTVARCTGITVFDG